MQAHPNFRTNIIFLSAALRVTRSKFKNADLDYLAGGLRRVAGGDRDPQRCVWVEGDGGWGGGG